MQIASEMNDFMSGDGDLLGFSTGTLTIILAFFLISVFSGLLSRKLLFPKILDILSKTERIDGRDLFAPRSLGWMIGLLVFWQGVEFLIIYREIVKSKKISGPLFGAGLEDSKGLFTPPRIAAESLIGLGVGLLGGAVGLILGSIRLPAIVRILKIDPRIAAGTNLFIGFFLGALGWIGHATQGKVDYPILILMGVVAMIGSWYGATLTGKVNLNTLILTMGFVLVVVGFLLAYKGVPII